MKRILGILLFSLFCFSTISPLLPYLEYAINSEYITEAFCINKNKPELKCDGKCYLKAQVEKASDDNTNKEKRSLRIELEKPTIFCQEININWRKEFDNYNSKSNIELYQFSLNLFSSKPPTPPPLKLNLIQQYS